MAELGVYIHFPWCRKLCPYCDFPVAIAPDGQIPHRAYLDAVLGELQARSDVYAGRDLTSIYFGGGTPSLWPAECLAAAIDAVRDRFGGVPREVTLEANPTDCTESALAAWTQAGITRVSVGLQSFDADELVTLGRDHRFGDGPAAVATAIAAGVRVTADVIAGTPGGTGLASVGKTAELGPGHISVYELTIEPRTAFARAVGRGELTPLSDDALAALYMDVHALLTGHGYEHYEISSYARPGERSVHNSLYWSGADYLGLGNGAASFRRFDGGAERRTNPRSVHAYLRGEGPAECLALAPEEVAADLAWLGMRTVDGVPEQAIAPSVVDWLTSEGLADRADGRIRPTLRGFMYADQVAARVVGASG